MIRHDNHYVLHYLSICSLLYSCLNSKRLMSVSHGFILTNFFVCSTCTFFFFHKYKPFYKCEQCDFMSKSRDTLRQHKSMKHSIRTKTTFVCDQCSYTSKQSVHLDIHVRSKHRGELFKCDMCDYKATQLSNLVRHKRSKHLVEEK